MNIRDKVTRVRQIINEIKTNCFGQQEPSLILNGHCSVCDFQPRCRRLALERDDLSLITAMTTKERKKLYARGISTITQLSYSYRPRRRKRTKSDTRPHAEGSTKPARGATPADRNDNKLKALAIKKDQIHVVGTPSLKFVGIPIFLDVEAMPDKDLFYLVGLRYQSGSEWLERSFWAECLEDERVIWEKCLQTLQTIGNAQIVSYGAYETRYLKRMKERYISSTDDAEFVDHLIGTSVNLVACIYGKIYFPTFSNSLKDVGRYFGFEWTWPQASGAAAPLLRRNWELSADNKLKRELIEYNMDDCRAAATVANGLMRIIAGAPGVDVVDASSLTTGFEKTWGRLDSSLPQFSKINVAAYWNYQRDRVYFRSNPNLARVIKRKRRANRRVLPVNKTVGPSQLLNCPDCSSKRRSMIGKHSGIIYDIKFSDGGLRRWITRHKVNHYKCLDCGTSFASDKRHTGRRKYGNELRSYVIYNLIELFIAQYKLADIMQRIFGLPMPQATISKIKRRAAEVYEDTYQGIKQRILLGNLIHADETHVSIKGNDSYVWIFTSMNDVIYVWSETREGQVAKEFLNNFNGVLVSDFYAVYDSIDCKQQKCLIHLMRDLNDDIRREPFNHEIMEIVHEFGELLKPVIDTIDRFGLKTRFLRKHKLAVAHFYSKLLNKEYATELAQAAQKRFKKNRDKLFTFLDYDSVPWNNNNAEHAVKAFADLRSVIDGTTTERGIREYLVLLSIKQTCAYREVDFLDFLRSGEMDIAGYPAGLTL